MKVAVVSSEVKHLPKEEKSKCFKEFSSQDELKKTLENDDNLWAVHTLANSFGKVQRQRYEDFCCGFLAFYDEIVRGGLTDHTIYFVWCEKGTEIKMYLYPPPKKRDIEINIIPPGAATSDPPKPPPPPPPSSY
jgi:hypothetical protein